MRILTFRLTTLVVVFLMSWGCLLAQGALPQASYHINQNTQKFGINPDIQWRVSDSYTDESGISHVYLLQTYRDIDVSNQQISVHIKEDAVFHSTGRFLSKIVQTVKDREVLTAAQALQVALQNRSLSTNRSLIPVSIARTADKETLFELDDIAKQTVKSKLIYTVVSSTDIRLTWEVDIYEKDGNNWWTVRVDAATGEVVKVHDKIIHCDFGAPDINEYNNRVKTLQAMTCEEEKEALANGFMDFSVYGRAKTCNNHAHQHAARSNSSNASTGMLANSYFALPLGIESPNHGAGGAASFVTLTDPADPVASPFGWHDTDGVAGAEFTITRGNNVFAYEDRTGADFSPDGGAGLDFNFVPDFAADPTTNPTQSAAITNLFVWNNFMHDVFYKYGFTEACGNFQENNYGNGGAGSDSVNAEAQDGGGTNNANFGTPADGGNPTMQMYLWDAPNPDIDGDFDNGIIAHEYGHGISTRLTGGPSNSGCLNGGEQMGEGWSDWWGLVLTVRPGDDADTPRGIGTYALNEATSGAGIRPFRYSRDMGVNPQTYGDVAGAVAPHGVGSIWCTMIWDLYWDLVDTYGYDNDLYNGTGGNNIAMNLITQGCKYQACSPGFVDGRDGILAADLALYGGANQCIIWDAFARRGVGVNAVQGSGSSQNDQTEDFTSPMDLPIPYTFTKTADKSTVACHEVVTFTLTTMVATASTCASVAPTNVNITDILPAGLTYVSGSVSGGGSEAGGTLTWPTITSLTTNQVYTYQATVDCSALGSGPVNIINDDVESGIDPALSISNTTNLSDWAITTTQAHSGSSSWYAEELNADPLTSENQYLTVGPFSLVGATELGFWHLFDTEINWDGGLVEISVDGGSSWADLGGDMTQNGYNDYLQNNPSIEGFAGLSGGWIETKIDLSSYENCEVLVRFNFYFDFTALGTAGNGIDDGWYIDDITLTTQASTFLKNTATLTESTQSITDALCLNVAYVSLAPRIFLQGPLSGTLMDLALGTDAMLPSTEPYTALGFTHVGGGGSEAITAAVGAITGNDRPVDWVFVELRDAATGNTVIATRSALLQADGDVVDVDGTSAVAFSVPVGTYHVAIRHRNHLGVMTATAVLID